MRLISSMLEAVGRQQGHLFPWSPVCLAIGIGLYFSFAQEPGGMIYTGLCLLMGLALWLCSYVSERGTPILGAIALVAIGFCLAGARAHLVARPVLDFRYYGPIEGRIVKIDRSASEAVRLTLDRVRLKNLPRAQTPKYVRISMHGQQGYFDPEPGIVVILTGHLSAPEGPVEPGGFDFQRMAWFQKLGAVGYTRTPVLPLENAESEIGVWVTRFRMALAGRVQTVLSGEIGAFAAAVTTGDRSAMSAATLRDLRRANLAHLLAISGLHMGMLTGFIFALTRYGLALVPWVALRLPAKQIAAVVALGAGLSYLALSGGSIATRRAFVMVAVMLIAVLLNRRALTLRAVGLAALILLVMKPESLLHPGFQMSFAATTALVAVFGGLSIHKLGWLPRPAKFALAVVLSSGIAGLATAPVAATHFNQIAHYGLLANVISVPVMGTIVMPGAVLAALLAPFGLAWVGLMVMGWGISIILWIAGVVSELPHAVRMVPSPGFWVLPLIGLGGCWGVLWQGRARYLGAVAICIALGMWSQVRRPDVLISDSGGLIGVLTPQGRVLNKPKGEGFAARSWLENDGDMALQDQAFERAGLRGRKGTQRFDLQGLHFLHLTGRGAVSRVPETCGPSEWVILAGTWKGQGAGIHQDLSQVTGQTRGESTQDPPDNFKGLCHILDRAILARTGALAFYKTGEEWQIISAHAAAGQRLWTRR